MKEGVSLTHCQQKVFQESQKWKEIKAAWKEIKVANNCCIFCKWWLGESSKANSDMLRKIT